MNYNQMKHKKVGIIANPASGKDIRRLISSGSVFSNQEKINIMVRMIAALDIARVDEVWIMQDPGGMAKRVLIEASTQHAKINEFELPYLLGTYKDTERCVQEMVKQQFDLLIVMGGDGTCRNVAKHCQDIPFLALSTGTNNVFPEMIEATLAGMAAAAFLMNEETSQHNIKQVPILEIRNSKMLLDIALVDLVLVDGYDTAARAVWEPSLIKEVFLTQARANAIGLSAIGGCYEPMKQDSQQAMHLILGQEGNKVYVPIAPGLMKQVTISQSHLFDRQAIKISHLPCVVALDGEREFVLNDSPENQEVSVHYNPKGPWVVDINTTLQHAAQSQFWQKIA